MTNQYSKMTLIHRDGSRWHPVLVKRRNTPLKAYRLGRPGAGSNKLDNTIFLEIGEEQKMCNLVLQHGYLVRCTNSSRTANMYGVGKGKRSISEVILDGKVDWNRQDSHETTG